MAILWFLSLYGDYQPMPYRGVPLIKTQDAIIRNIEILGEAAELLSKKAKEKYPNVPWKDIAGTREKLIHDYFGVNIDVVWSIVRHDIPLLKKETEKADG